MVSYFEDKHLPFLFDHPLILPCTPSPQCVLPSLPGCSCSLLPSVPIREWCFLMCTFLLPLWENVFPQIWHWWGFTPWSRRGKKCPNNYQIWNKDLISQEANNTVGVDTTGANYQWIKTNEKYSCFLECNKLSEQKRFRYQYCQLLEISSLESNIKSSTLIYEREQVIWNLLVSDMEIFNVPYLE